MSAFVFEMLPDAEDGIRISRGIFASAPPNVDTQVYVVLPEFDTTQKWGPCPWMPRGATLPAVGDKCLVIFDNTDAAWVVAWWPSD
jgi:hypothetical protein